jgi:enoyl-CoA hydratase/carnithine racemase
MEYKNYNFLKIRVEKNVAFATIDKPPMNILDIPLFTELGRFMTEAASDNDVKVLVFDSADPDFFIAHFDVSVLAHDKTIFPTELPPKPTEPDGINKLFLAYRSLPKVTIAKIEGIVGGGGSEFILGLDMRFGSLEKSQYYQPEGILGIIPGGGGPQWLTWLMGSSRTLEIILGCDRVSADVAEKYGWINRAIHHDSLGEFVNDLAFRIAMLPSETIGFLKQSVVAADDLSKSEALTENRHLFNKSMILPEARRRMKQYIALNGQTREVETNFDKQIELLKKIIHQRV